MEGDAMPNTLVTAVAALPVMFLTWVTFIFIGKPIQDAATKRIEALDAAEQNWMAGARADQGRIEAARAALRDAGSKLRSVSRGHPWSVGLYCRLFGYDFEMAELALINLHNIVGRPGHDHEERQLVRD